MAYHLNMNQENFLKWGGAALVGLSILGFMLPGGRIFGSSWYFTNYENWGHLIAGALLLFTWHFDSRTLSRRVILATIVVSFYFMLAGFLVRDLMPLNYYGTANFEYPWDELLHLVFIIWPAYIVWREKRAE